MLDKLRAYFEGKTLHDYDLENPEYMRYNNRSFTRYHCKNCDKTLALDLWQMKQLPYSMKTGCVPVNKK